jgi:acetyl-CoA C-acetyltransferase
LAFPYNKWHSTQWTVDQAAALVLCSVEAARRLGVPTDRWVFPHVGLESSQAVSLLARREPHRWPAMGVLGRAAAGWTGRPVADAEVVEVYSCFPAAVRVQQRELGLDPEGTPTVTGGMAFAGGPFNNFVYQATSEVVGRLRADPGARGLVTTVSGLLTKPGLAVWSTEPDPRGPLLGDLATEAARVTAQVPVVATLDGYAGPATVATYTVTPDGQEPAHTVVVGDTGDGRRCVAFSDDRELAAHVEATEFIGSAVTVEAGSFVPAGTGG